MSLNRFQPQVLVLPEDDANRQIVNGFLLDHGIALNKIQVLSPSGGWLKVLQEFKSKHIPAMREYNQRLMVLLIDFDDDVETRLPEVQAVVPSELHGRVFVVGVKSEPEDLRNALAQSFETIGRALAQDCREETNTTWGHPLLAHNAGELSRLRSLVRPILF
jgi:hypothetical protein